MHTLKWSQKTSLSLQVLDHFLGTYKENKQDDEVIEQINLYEDVVPMIDKIVLSGWNIHEMEIL